LGYLSFYHDICHSNGCFSNSFGPRCVKLSEIRHAISLNSSSHLNTPPQAASIAPISGSANALRCGVPVLPRTTGTGSKSRSEPPQFHSADSTPTRCVRNDDLALSPPPPPPAPHTRLLTGGSIRSVNSSGPYTNGAMSLSSGSGSLVHNPQSRRVLRVPNVGKPKLFGGTIDEYVEATKQEIPCILLSCTRQGIFRVSGSQTEIIEFKAAFERGEDPLVDVHEARDINSTAGLFKLYFRELGEPPFPNTLFLSLIECARDSKSVCNLFSIYF
uniref:Rho-GAP domain-containing protein n=1 Tax=Echinostoma caproni TaxID=27848 RepID=A0A183ACC8_9TREM